MFFFKRLLPPSFRSFHARSDQQLQAIGSLRNESEQINNEMNLLSHSDQLLQAIGELKSELELIKTEINIKNEKTSANDSEELVKKIAVIETEMNLLRNNVKINYSDLVRGMEKSLAVSMINSDAFSGYKNKFEGRSVVVCATGPTLNDYEPIENAIHIGVNRAFLQKDILFDFLFAQCWSAISHCKKELKEYKGNNCIKFFGIEGVTWSNGEIGASGIPEDYAISCNAKRYATDFFSRGERCFDWTTDLCSQSISTGWSSALPAIQFALYTNPAKLYIVGCDTSTSGHFTEETCDAEYIERSNMGLRNEAEKIKENFKSISSFAKAMYPDMAIISINPVGLKGIFKDEYTEN